MSGLSIPPYKPGDPLKASTVNALLRSTGLLAPEGVSGNGIAATVEPATNYQIDVGTVSDSIQKCSVIYYNPTNRTWSTTKVENSVACTNGGNLPVNGKLSVVPLVPGRKYVLRGTLTKGTGAVWNGTSLTEADSTADFVVVQDTANGHNQVVYNAVSSGATPAEPTETAGVLQTPLVMIQLDQDYIVYKNHQLRLYDSLSEKGQQSNYSLAKLLSRAVGRVRIGGGASEKIETWKAGEKGKEPKQSPLGQELMRQDVPNSAISGDYIICYHKRGENKYQIVNGKVEPVYTKKRKSAKVLDKYAGMRSIELSEYYEEEEPDDPDEDGADDNNNEKDDDVYQLFFKTIKTDQNLIHDPQCLCISGMAESEYLLPGDVVNIKDTVDIVAPDSFLYDEYNYPIPNHYAGSVLDKEDLPDKWWVSQVPPQYAQSADTAVEWARAQHFIAFVGNPRFETLVSYLLHPRTGARRDQWVSYNFEKTEDHKKGDQILASQIKIVEPKDDHYNIAIVGQVDVAEDSEEHAQVELFFNRISNNRNSEKGSGWVRSLDGALIKIVSASEFAEDRDSIIDDIVGDDEEGDDGGDDESNQQIKVLRKSLTLYYVVESLPETTSIGNCGCDSTVLGAYTRKGSDGIDYIFILDSSYLPIGYALRGEEITCSYPGVTGQCSPRRRKITYTMQRVPKASGGYQLQIVSGVCAVPCTFIAPPK
jgi:hypothetical protein